MSFLLGTSLLAVTLAVFASIVATLERQLEWVLLQAITRSSSKDAAHSQLLQGLPPDPCRARCSLYPKRQCSGWSYFWRNRCISTSVVIVGLSCQYTVLISTAVHSFKWWLPRTLHVSFTPAPWSVLTSRSSSPGRDVTHSAKLSSKLGTFAPCTLLLRMPFYK